MAIEPTLTCTYRCRVIKWKFYLFNLMMFVVTSTLLWPWNNGQLSCINSSWSVQIVSNIRHIPSTVVFCSYHYQQMLSHSLYWYLLTLVPYGEYPNMIQTGNHLINNETKGFAMLSLSIRGQIVIGTRESFQYLSIYIY